MKKLAIVSSHPIQYNAPLFALLSKRGNIDVKVFYTWGEEVLKEKYDPGFTRSIQWDIPLLEGYNWQFEKNTSKTPGSHHFNGIINPFLIDNITRWGADAVLVYGWSFSSHLNVLRHFHNKRKVFFRGDSTFVNNTPFIKRVLRISFLRWVYSHIDTALYVGTHNRHYFEKCGLKNQQLVFAPHAIDNTRFMQPAEILKAQALQTRCELGIAADAVVFLYAGKLDANKNVGLLVDAFLRLNATDTHLVIAGNGVMEEALKMKAAGKINIHFLPFQNQQQMPVLYRVGDVFVLPSVSETWGLSLNEAMACGCALCVSDTCGAAADLVSDGINGYVFCNNDSEHLMEAMALLSSSKAMAAGMGKRSAEKISHWNFEKVCATIEAELHKY